MKVIFADVQKKHDPKSFFSSGATQPNPEVPERAMRLLAAARHSGLALESPDDYGLQFISQVHSPEYIHYLQHIFERWSRIEDGSDEVIAGIHPDRRDGGYPRSAVGQAGWHHYDTASPIAAATWESALWSAHSATHAAVSVLEGAPAAYALCRPPGHHASREMAGGFCYLSNAAIATEALLMQFARVAILDVDVHHGNGSQGVFYRRDDVLTVSLHADPVRFYPFFWGHRDERGEGQGLGYNLNVPLPRGTGDDRYLESLDQALARIAAFDPGALVIALGLDAHEDDPLRGLAITTDGFARIGEAIGAYSLPTVLVQEGGYLSDALGPNLSAFLEGFGRTHGGGTAD
ncbi:MAG: histone deacetylase family protein [Woeseiaceae bacterium]|nr:histone deacetylase family protein [Woeseiaceae bacterium]